MLLLSVYGPNLSSQFHISTLFCRYVCINMKRTMEFLNNKQRPLRKNPLKLVLTLEHILWKLQRLFRADLVYSVSFNIMSEISSEYFIIIFSLYTLSNILSVKIDFQTNILNFFIIFFLNFPLLKKVPILQNMMNGFHPETDKAINFRRKSNFFT